MAAITYQDTKEIKEGIVRIHRHLELRKLRLHRLRAKQLRINSFNHATGTPKQENA